MKKLTIKDFVEKNLAVSFETFGEYKEFLKLCASAGLDCKYHQDHIEPSDVALILTCGCGYDFFRLCNDEYKVTSWGNIYAYESDSRCKEWKLTPAKLFLDNTETKIEVFQSGKAVIALKKVGGKVVAKGVAKCCPEDTFDFDYGAKLALDRLYGNTICKVAHKPITRKQYKYKVGDKVLIVNDLESLDHGYVTYRDKQLQGKTATISKILNGHGRYELEEDVEKSVWFNDEFVGKIV